MLFRADMSIADSLLLGLEGSSSGDELVAPLGLMLLTAVDSVVRLSLVGLAVEAVIDS